MGELDDPVVVELPLRGEWSVERSPADRIPSHGTDLLGQRYAYDLVRTDHRPGLHLHPAGTLRWLLIGGRTRDCYGWGQPVHAALDGVIVQAVDGVASAGGSMWTSTRNSRRVPTSTARLVTCSKLAGRQALLVGAIGAGIVVRAPKGRDPVHGVRWSAAWEPRPPDAGAGTWVSGSGRTRWRDSG